MASTEWVDVILSLYDHINGLSVFIYPVWWGMKIFKKIGYRGL